MIHCDPHGVDLCLALPLGYTSTYRSELAQVVLENIGAKSVFFASQPVLCGFSSGHPTCTIIDSGYTYTSIFGMNDLYPERATELMLPIGGRDIDRYLTHLGSNLKNASQSDINYIKSHLCEVSSDLPGPHGAKHSYQMPDGRNLKLGSELKMSPELLFNPTMAGLSRTPPIDRAILQSAEVLPRDKATAVLQTVVFSGGNLKFDGLGERLKKAIAGQMKYKDTKIRSHPCAELAVWKGGAVFASSPGYRSMCITKERWREHGELIVQKRWL